MENEKLIYEGNTEAITKIMFNRQNTGSRKGFIFGQSGKGQAIHTTTQPSGMALAARQEMEHALQSVSEPVVIIDPENIDPKLDVDSMRESIIQKIWKYARYYCGEKPVTFDELTQAIGLTKEEFLYLMAIEELG